MEVRASRGQLAQGQEIAMKIWLSLRAALARTLLAFDNAIEPGDTAFFFYAGHGFEIAGQNFLLPTDVPAATEGQEELVRDASILADRIIERLQNKKARTSILVFDACRNNPFE